MQDAQAVPLPQSPVRQASISPAITGPTWSDFHKLYKDIMSIAFFLDPQSRQAVLSRGEAERTVANLTDRLQKETDEDFIQLAQKKFDSATLHLEQLKEEFEGGHVGDIHNRFNEFSSSFLGPRFALEESFHFGQ